MKPVMQTLFYDKDGVGNCFEACLASIFELDILDVPMFHETDWFTSFFEWIQEKGYTYYGALNAEAVKTYDKGLGGYFIVAGESPRGKHIKGGHAVIFKDGQMVHDPHPDGTGILMVSYGLVIEKEEQTN
jgi:hypothetical protein